MSANEEQPQSGFAPADLTDGRKVLDWKSGYVDREARRGIVLEAVYLAIFLFVVPAAMLVVWLEIPKNWVSMEDTQYGTLVRYAYAWLGGVFGGTLFSMKWLYHIVAKQRWHLDRRMWRLFTPHLSGGLGFVFVLLISSGILRLFDQAAFDTPSVSLAIGFMVGYFSDHATAKLTEVAETLFGPIRRRRQGVNPSRVASSDRAT